MIVCKKRAQKLFLKIIFIFLPLLVLVMIFATDPTTQEFTPTFLTMLAGFKRM
jgi:hypothetical protein